MNDTERIRTTAQLMRDVKEDWGGITKTQLKAAVEAMDDYLIANAAAINLVIPLAARTALTASQKAQIMGYVAMRRAGKLRAEEDG